MDEQTKQKRKDIVGWVIYIAVLLAIIITFRCFLMIGRVPSESMEPTLMYTFPPTKETVSPGSPITRLTMVSFSSF